MRLALGVYYLALSNYTLATENLNQGIALLGNRTHLDLVIIVHQILLGFAYHKAQFKALALKALREANANAQRLLQQRRRLPLGMVDRFDQDVPGSIAEGFRQLAKILLADANRTAEDINEAFMAIQWAEQTEAALALYEADGRKRLPKSAADIYRERQEGVEFINGAERLLAYQSTIEYPRRNLEGEKRLREELEQRRKRVKEIDAENAMLSPYATNLSSKQPIDLLQIKSILKSNEILLTYTLVSNDLIRHSDENVSFIRFAVTNGGLIEAKFEASGRKVVTLADSLRCGLDASFWALGEASRDRCKALLNVSVDETQTPPFDAFAANDLFRELFSGIEQQINDKSLLLVTSGVLSQIPFEVLVTEKPSEYVNRFEAYRSAQWLAATNPITVLPSIPSLKIIGAPSGTSSDKPFVGFGNPLLTGPDGTDRRAWDKQSCKSHYALNRARVAIHPPILASVSPRGKVDTEVLRRQVPLPETADELCAVGDTLGGSAADANESVYLGARATVTQVKALSKSGALARVNVLHFATHGLLATETTKFLEGTSEPALLLTPPSNPTPEDNGLLIASDIAKLELNADWVILSACNTAAARSENAEAFSGLSRAFFAAGARSLLVSHWYVNSEAAVAITTGAINQLKGDSRIGKAEALRRSLAALRSRKDGMDHPSVWAPFVLVGTQ